MCDAVNPDLVVKHEKLMADGDDCCLIAFELEEGGIDTPVSQRKRDWLSRAVR